VLVTDVNVALVAGHLMADRGACVSDCGAGRHANSDGKCVPCEGPCAKSESANSADCSGVILCYIYCGYLITEQLPIITVCRSWEAASKLVSFEAAVKDNY